ncbi:MAG: type II secretion system protein, partial [bacterium]
MKTNRNSQAPRSDKPTMSNNSHVCQESVCVSGFRIPQKHRAVTLAVSRRPAFTLLEVVVAAAILGLGLMAIVRVFPIGLAAADRSEGFTRAALLARSIFEGLKADEVDFPVVTTWTTGMNGEKVLISCPIPLPGNGYDDDGDWYVNFSTPQRRPGVDLNGNGKPDIDFDGLGEPPYLRNNGVDDDGDGIVDDNGDGLFPLSSLPPGASSLGNLLRIVAQQDGNVFYDPEPGIEEEISNGLDDDRDGLIDEDCRLFSVLVPGKGFRPTLAGDGKDNDGDGQIDEEIFDFLDKATINSSGKGGAADGLVDEDCGLARFPWSPAPFGPPDDTFYWQVFVGVVPDVDIPQVEQGERGRNPLYARILAGDLGDGVDNDGDGLTDEELRDGVDNDEDGLIDEDCIAGPTSGVRRVEIVITWGGDGEDEDGDRKSVHPQGLTFVPGRGSLPYGAVSWGVDEEERDGLDNDLDGRIYEDCYEFSYKLVGYLPIKSKTEGTETRMV